MIKKCLPVIVLMCIVISLHAQTIGSYSITKPADNAFITGVLKNCKHVWNYAEGDGTNWKEKRKQITGFLKRSFKASVLNDVYALSSCGFSMDKQQPRIFIGLVEINYSNAKACNKAYMEFKSRTNGALNYEVLTVFQTLRQNNNIVIIYTENTSDQMMKLFKELKSKY